MGLGNWLDKRNPRDEHDDSAWGPLPALFVLVALYALFIVVLLVFA